MSELGYIPRIAAIAATRVAGAGLIVGLVSSCTMENPAFSKGGEYVVDPAPGGALSTAQDGPQAGASAGVTIRLDESGLGGTPSVSTTGSTQEFIPGSTPESIPSSTPEVISSSTSATSSLTTQSTEATSSTPMVDEYCGQGPLACFLTNKADITASVIREPLGSNLDMTRTGGTIGQGPPGLPESVPSMEVSAAGAVASSDLHFATPYPQGFAFDFYAKLPQEPVIASYVFGIYKQLVFVYAGDGSLKCSLYDQSESSNYSDTAGIEHTDDQWHHYACAFDGHSIQAWKDGVPTAKEPVSTQSPLSPGPMQLGGHADIWYRPKGGGQQRDFGSFIGSLSAIRIWTDLDAFARAMN